MPVFPGMYPAKVIKISNLNLQVLVPQVFGEAVVAVQRTLGGWPTSVGLGWVTFVAGNPEFPVWASGVSIAGPAGPAGEAGAPGGGVSQRNYTFDNRTVEEDPGSGKLRTNNNDESLVTEVYVSLYGAGGQVAPGIALLDTGDEFLLYESNDFGASVRYEITTTPTITDNLWSLIPVTIVEYNGFTPTNNQDVVAFISTPPPIAPVNEVWIGTADPIATNPTIELWYDTDAVPGPGAYANDAVNLSNLTVPVSWGDWTGSVMQVKATTGVPLAFLATVTGYATNFSDVNAGPVYSRLGASFDGGTTWTYSPQTESTPILQATPFTNRAPLLSRYRFSGTPTGNVFVKAQLQDTGHAAGSTAANAGVISWQYIAGVP